MDPVTVILGALSVAGAKVGDQVIKDGYAGLKAFQNAEIVYDATVVRPLVTGSRFVLWKGVDVGLIDGIVTPINYAGYGKAYEFMSIDGTLHLVIAKDKNGKWQRVDGTEPYFSGWIDELLEQVAQSQH